jgi:hypothetical protein
MRTDGRTDGQTWRTWQPLFAILRTRQQDSKTFPTQCICTLPCGYHKTQHIRWHVSTTGVSYGSTVLCEVRTESLYINCWLILPSVLYTITLCTSSALTCWLRYVKLLMGYGGSSTNHTQSSLFVHYFIYFYLRCNVWTCSVNQIQSCTN